MGGHSPSVVKKNIAEIREMTKMQFGRDPASIKFLALLCPILGKTEEEAKEKFAYYRRLGSIDGALALFGGWTGIDLDTYGDDQELRTVESNAIRYVFVIPPSSERSLITGIDPPSKAGPKPPPKFPNGQRRQSASTSPSEVSAQQPSAHHSKSQTKWRNGLMRLTLTVSTS